MRCPECARQTHQGAHGARRWPSDAARDLRADRDQRRRVPRRAGPALGCGDRDRRAASDRERRARPAATSRSQHGEYWRLVTGGFLHANLLHIGFNMYLLYLLGPMLEPAIGTVRFARDLLHRAAARARSARWSRRRRADRRRLGRDLRADGRGGRRAARARGYRSMRVGHRRADRASTWCSASASPNISVGGHVGGLIGGALAALALRAAERSPRGALGCSRCAALVVAIASRARSRVAGDRGCIGSTARAVTRRG